MNKLVKELQELEDESNNYVVGHPDTYSQYAEGWQDCLDMVMQIVKGEGNEAD